MKRLIAITALAAGLSHGQEAFSDFTAMSEALASGDLFAVSDVSDTTDALTGTTKKLTWTQLLATLDDANFTWTGTHAFSSLAVTTFGIADNVDQSHDLNFVAASNLTADRSLTITTGDVAVSLDLSDIGEDGFYMWDDTNAKFVAISLPAGYSIVGSQVVPALFTEIHSASHTLTAAECYGGVYYVDAASTVLTLPAVADGMSVTVISNTANTVTVDANANDLIYLDGTALDDGDSIDSSGAAGDIAVFTYYSAVGWFASTNGWTDGGP